MWCLCNWVVWFLKLSRWDRLIIFCKLFLLSIKISSECKCNTIGSEDIGCTDKEGQCTCKDGYTGLKCDTCAAGWFMVNGKCHGKFPLFMYIILLPIKKMTNHYSLSEGCTIHDFAFTGHDILVSGEYNMHDGWFECQQACQFITECKWWTYYGDTVADKEKANHCELKWFDDVDQDQDIVGAVSGPRDCPSHTSRY